MVGVSDPIIRANSIEIAGDVQFGENVLIEADTVQIGAGAQIGLSGDDDFRTAPGVRITVNRLVLGAGVRIGSAVKIGGGAVHLAQDVTVHRLSTIHVVDNLEIGQGGIVGEASEIYGRQIHIGQQLWTGPGARIGGGSALESTSQLTAGHYLHLGLDTFVNTARPVVIGHEVGLGTRTSIYTHGAYPSRLQGFPVAFDGVTIGDFTWIPGAVINPGVHIGRNCVIGVNSLVTSDIPDGSLAAGSPAKVIREGAYPRPLTAEQRLTFFESFLRAYAQVLGVGDEPVRSERAVYLSAAGVTYLAGPPGEVPGPASGTARVVAIGDGWTEVSIPSHWTAFDTVRRRVSGTADANSERFANELRRQGIRFYSRPAGERYRDWDVPVPEYSGVAAPTEDEAGAAGLPLNA